MSRMVPTATVELDRERTLRLDFEAMRRFKKATGLSILKGELTEKTTDEDTIVALVHSMLVHEDPELTLSDVGAMIHTGNVDEIMAAVQKLNVGDSAGPEDGEQDPTTATSPTS